ncbi:hypothetical protein RA086_01230 [Lactiplantibacillus sp. WILCCON 0030]|uniref:Uncharacterized protein n=1 Tax=Lactiplantibacillus brownii TaxID=3069269 RepID=A0ABU1A763_9LACO|nr:hypothetical protein [Lactiplantibacillus brownii]MDQ7936273.1 hypothetical protein [Lactiplantibacillus brownii]
MTPKSSNVRLEFAAEVLRNEVFDVVDFASFQRFWQRYEHFLEDRMVNGHLNVLEGHGLIPSDFKDVGGRLGYHAGDEQYQIDYSQIVREWIVTIQ